MVSFEDIEEVFKKLEGKLEWYEFMAKVEEKVTMMNGLCDAKTAAMFVAKEMKMNETVKIKDMIHDKSNVMFLAKVLSVSDVREFSRDNDTVGRVVNLTLADDTGTIKAALWDEGVDLMKIGYIKMGQSLKVKGYLKKGPTGFEVNVGRGGGVELIDVIEQIEDACESCEYYGKRTCGRCIHGGLYSPRESKIAKEIEKRPPNTFRFAPPSQSERIVFGAQRPGHSINEVNEWIAFMKEEGIKRICCLLPEDQLNCYDGIDLLNLYSKEFGKENICWSEIEDYHLCDEVKLIEIILPFLMESDIREKPVVVHCSGGSGRTGHVLAAWLVFGRAFSIDEALSSVRKMNRNPCEAVDFGNATRDELYGLLKACQTFITKRIERYNEFCTKSPNFTLYKGICWNCKCQIFYHYDGTEFITGCPYCSRSYCE